MTAAKYLPSTIPERLKRDWSITSWSVFLLRSSLKSRMVNMGTVSRNIKVILLEVSL